MIDCARLRELHDVDLPFYILKQDYIQALFPQELYRETDALVFEGGTFLKHAHGLDRFSEDLGFTRETGTPFHFDARGRRSRAPVAAAVLSVPGDPRGHGTVFADRGGVRGEAPGTRHAIRRPGPLQRNPNGRVVTGRSGGTQSRRRIRSQVEHRRTASPLWSSRTGSGSG